MLYFSSIISGIILGFLGDAQKHNTRIFERNVSDPSQEILCLKISSEGQVYPEIFKFNNKLRVVLRNPTILVCPR